jgi:hypothetical protein
MGEIAEMMLEGILDCETGEYLGDAVGYPRTYSDRVGPARELTRGQKRNLQRKRAKVRKAAKAKS